MHIFSVMLQIEYWFSVEPLGGTAADQMNFANLYNTVRKSSRVFGGELIWF